jgi:uncharacterized protein YuzE
VNYNPEEDSLYIVARDSRVFDSKENDEDIRLEYGRDGEVAGIEIINTRRNLAKALAQEIAREIKAAAANSLLNRLQTSPEKTEQ